MTRVPKESLADRKILIDKIIKQVASHFPMLYAVKSLTLVYELDFVVEFVSFIYQLTNTLIRKLTEGSGLTIYFIRT